MTSELQQETPDQDQAVPVDATPPKRLGMSTSVQLLGIALAFVALGAVMLIGVPVSLGLKDTR